MDERGKSGRKIYSGDADAGGKPDLQAGSPRRLSATLITTFYNIKRAFLSANPFSASGAVGIAFAVMAAIQAVSFLCGRAREYLFTSSREQETDKAERLAASDFILRLSAGVNSTTGLFS